MDTRMAFGEPLSNGTSVSKAFQPNANDAARWQPASQQKKQILS
jgi:hypothetical protein